MNKSIKIGAGIVVALILIIFIVIPATIKPILEHKLHDAGFEQAHIGSASFSFSGTTVKDITLDDAGDTVAEARVTASPKDIMSGHLASVAVNGAKLQWPFPLPAAGRAVGVLNLVARLVNLSNIAVTVNTPAGKLPVTVSGNIVDMGDDEYRADNLDVKADAPFAMIDGKLSADILKATREIKAEFKIKDAQLTLANATIPHAAGTIRADIEPSKAFSIPAAQLTFGAVTLYGLPLQGASLKIAGDKDRAEVLATAEVPNNSGDLALDLSLDRKEKDVDKISLHAEAKLRKLDALNLANLKGEGNLLLALTGARGKTSDIWDMTQWKDLQGSAGVDMEKLSLPGLLKDAEALASVKLSLDPANQVVTAQQVDGAMAFNGTFVPVDLLPLTLNIPANVKTPATITWDQKSKKLKADFDGADFQGLSVMAKQVSAHLTADVSAQPALEGTVDSDEVSHMTIPQSQLFLPVQVALRLAPSKDKPGYTTFTGKASDKKGRVAAKLSGEQSFAASTGDLSVKVPPTALQPGVTSLVMIFPISQRYLSDGYGIVGVSGDFIWEKKGGQWASDSRGQLYLKDFSATVKGIPVSGVNTVLDLDTLFPLSFTKQPVSVGAVNLGLPLTTGQAAISLKDGVFGADEAHWSLLGGQVSSIPFSVDLKEMSTDVTLTGKGLDLAQIFQLIPAEGLEASGAVDATIPLEIRHGTISLVNAVFQTTAKGTIRYDAAHLPSFLGSNQQSTLTDLKTALTHFNYDSLRVTVNGTLGQTQAVTLQVHGQNPLFYSGKPVDFSLKLNGAFDAAARAASGAGSVPSAISQAFAAFESGKSTH